VDEEVIDSSEDEWSTVGKEIEDDDDDLFGLIPAESREESEEEEKDSEDSSLELSSFNPKWRIPFEGLAYLGHLEGIVDSIPYHHFVVRTLTVGEKIKVNEITVAFENTIGYGRAYRAAVTAAGLVTADGKPIIVAERNVDVVLQKFRWVLDNWYDPVIDACYEKIDELEGNVVNILDELGVYEKRMKVALEEPIEIAGKNDQGVV